MSSRSPSLSFGQQRVWLAEQVAEDFPPYNVAQMVRLNGVLDEARLLRALRTLIARHEPLRTIYASVDGVLQGEFRDADEFLISVHDLSGLSNPEAEKELSIHIEKEAAAWFDLERDFPIRAALLRLGAEDNVLLLTVHHIATDGMSQSLLWKELDRLYGSSSGLPALPFSYSGYATSQRASLEETVQQDLEFWRQTLAGLQYLELPADHPRTGTGHRREAVSLDFPASLIAQANGLRKETGTTPHMLLLASYMVFLGRWTGQEDLAVAVPTAGRHSTEVESLIGFFINTVVIRVRLPKTTTFRQLLRDVRQASLETWDHVEMPFDRIVEELAPERVDAGTPFTSTLFQLLETPRPPPGLGELAVTEIRDTSRSLRFEVEILLRRTQDGSVRGQMSYDHRRFEAASMQRLARYYTLLTDNLLRYPDLPLHEVPLVSEDEQRRMWSTLATPVPLPDELLPVHQLFERQAANRGDAPAIVGAASISYRELNDRANTIADRLAACLPGRSAMVAVLLPKSVDLVASLLGIFKVGAVYLPLDPSQPAERNRSVVDDAGVRVVLTASRWRHLVDESVPVLLVDGPQPSRISSENPVTARDLQAPAYVMYTSGSTGKPKGVLMPHRSLANFFRVVRATLDLGDTFRFLGIAPATFDISLLELVFPLCHGGTSVLLSREEEQDSDLLSRALARWRPDVMEATPSLWSVLVDSGWRGADNLILISTAELLTPALAVRLLECGREVWDFYGPTETNVVTIRRVAAGQPRGFLGRVIDNCAACIVDAALQVLPPGIPGELCVGGLGTGLGYLNRPELSVERFIRDGLGRGTAGLFYRTGDRCRWLNDGELQLLGRLDDQLKIRGFRVEPGEIESVIAQHPGVGRCVVVGLEDPAGNMNLRAFLIPAAAARLPPPAELAGFLRDRLPDYMVPAAFTEVENLPTTPTGKVDRGALITAALREAPPSSGGAPLETESERLLGEVWGNLLQCETPGADVSFFELGGHSILLMRLASAIAARVGQSPPFAFLYQHPTIRAQARWIDVAHGRSTT